MTDNVTKLVWQRALPATYPGCSEMFLADSRAVGEACTWSEAEKYCRDEVVSPKLGGTGWRLPTKIELESILDETRLEPSIDTEVFPDTPSQPFWTSTPITLRPTILDNFPPGVSPPVETWEIDFGSVEAIAIAVTPAAVRCVRSSAAPAFDDSMSRYVVENATVFDPQTTLTWQQRAHPTLLDYAAAESYCQTLELAGSGWRLPGLKELLTLVDPTRVEPAMDGMFAVDVSTERGSLGWYFWTASKNLKDRDGVGLRLLVSFDDGSFDGGGLLALTPNPMAGVRCVR